MLRFAMAVACAAVAFAAAGADTVSLIGPAAPAIVLTGSEASLRVYYSATAKKQPAVSITDAGPLVAGKHLSVRPVAGAPGSVPSVMIDVKAPPGLLAPGESVTAALVFTNDAAEVLLHPNVTISRVKPSFTAAVVDDDICLDCDGPRALTLLVTNSGAVPIRRLDLGLLMMKDGTRDLRLQLPADGACPEAKKESPHHVIAPCTSGAVSIAPAQQQKITVPIPRPPHAGTYTTTFDVSIPGVQSAALSATVRTRGPAHGPSPLVRFFFWTALGIVLAYLFEWYFGSGGGRAKSKARIALESMKSDLATLLAYAANGGLSTTASRIGEDLALIDRAINEIGDLSQEQLAAVVAGFETRLEKRLRLRYWVEEARLKYPDKIKDLDKASDAGDVEAYAKRLKAILGIDAELAALPEAHPAKGKAIVFFLRLRDWFLKYVQALVLISVTLVMAYMLLFDGECSYGSGVDYATAFLWGLGVTQAGNTLIGKATSKYTKPAKP